MPLYHYTDVNAVKSILCNNTIWLTDLRYLNDSRELKDGISVFLKSFDKWRPTLWTKREYSRQVIEYLKSELNSTLIYGTGEEIQCTCSFSRAIDQLSQWRAYGNYAVEFDEKVLSQSLPNLFNCKYEIETKHDQAFSCITSSIDAICTYMSQNDGNMGITVIDELIKIIELAATFKDEGFAEEKEVRALISVNESDEIVKFRTRGHLLVPYIEQPISLDCVKSIYLGPMNNQELAYESLRGLVRQVEKNHQFESGNIEYELEIKKSPIPFRTL